MHRPLSLRTRVTATPSHVSADLDGELVILSLRDGVYYGLNPVGARIWTELRDTRTIAELRDVLLAEYDVDPSTCERDVRELIDELAEHELVELQSDGADE